MVTSVLNHVLPREIYYWCSLHHYQFIRSSADSKEDYKRMQGNISHHNRSGAVGQWGI